MQHQTLIIEEFEPDVFRQLIEYIHTGCVTLQPRTLLGKNKKKSKISFN